MLGTFITKVKRNMINMKNLFRISGVILVVLSIFLVHSCKKEEVPVITTTAGSNITATTATSGGNITNEGSSTVITRGVCWSTGTTPTIADNKTTDAAGAGSFISNITGLEGGTIYYVRAYATNVAGTGYGTAMSFTTLGQAPTATAEIATNITTTSATLNGSTNANYLSTVVTFEYGTTINYGSTISAKQSPITGSTNTPVSADLTGLAPGTTYHLIIKTVNTRGTVYGSDMTFTTLGQAPVPINTAVTNITTVSATLNGSVNPNYLSTELTFEYGTATSYGSTVTAIQSPVTGNSSTNISADITGLTPGTIYHYRVKAVNSLGTTYSGDITFTTLGQVPTVTTLAATNISTTIASLNGSVNANYLSSVVTFEYGITTDYGSTITAIQSPVTENTIINISANITGLTAGTTYHFRVKAVNELGTTYGNDLAFTTSFTGITGTVNDIDGNIYKTIGIGSQTWMAENLKTTKYNDGTSIPIVTDGTAWAALSTPGYCWYNNDEATYKAIYGALYNWYTVGTGKLCPTGWHVPSDAEWTTLTTYLGGEYVAGGKLKETGTTHWTNTNEWVTNEMGFTALPGGNRINGGAFSSVGLIGDWWSDTETGAYVWYRLMFYSGINVGRSSSGKQIGSSVRCVRDF